MADGIIQTGFEKLLTLLDAERETAGAKYEALRLRLIKYFEWRNCEACEELADTVFDRVVRKIEEGEEIQNLNAYALTIAQYVFKEYCRRVQNKTENIEDSNALQIAAHDEKDETKEKRFTCLEKCLEKFSDENRRLIVAYYDTDERTMIAARKRLADSMNVSTNNLRIRVCRLKSKLEECTFECCAENDK